MANPSKAKGTAAETRIVNYLKAAGLEAIRQPLSGNKDIGDIRVTAVPFDIVLEVKAGKQTRTVSRSTLESWLEQARQEGLTFNNQAGLLVIAEHGANIADYKVWHPHRNRCSFWFLDDWVRSLGGTPQLFKGGKEVGDADTC